MSERDPVLGFFLGNCFLEEGDFVKAREAVSNPGCKEYMKKVEPVHGQLAFERGDTRWLNRISRLFSLTVS